jgi:16S rRNA (guanine966-N2)-methyltransferase
VVGDTTRSTKDRVKEAIFNRLQHRQSLDSVLDLFAGSGALAFEAYSRGAVSVTAVERDATALAVLKRNRESLAVRIEIEAIDALIYLKNTPLSFDVILVDPPYPADLYEETLNLIHTHKRLKSGGTVVILHEHPLKDFLGFICVKHQRYGRTQVSYYEEM